MKKNTKLSIILITICFIFIFSTSCSELANEVEMIKAAFNKSDETYITNSVNTTETTNSKTVDSSEETTIITSAITTDYPEPVSFVNDFANVFTEEEKLQMDNFLYDFERETTAEIAVVTINSLEGLTIEQYAYGLFNSWGIGKKNINNGMLLLISIGDRKLRIETGLGLESVVTNDEAAKIIDEIIVPYFREGNFGQGAFEGVKAIAKEISISS